MTLPQIGDYVDQCDFNPHAPCGARQLRKLERDNQPRFQSTCPLRGTTLEVRNGIAQLAVISIHVPLAGHDYHGTAQNLSVAHFNPRAPCGARHIRQFGAYTPNEISIHVPLAGHDNDADNLSSGSSISIHVPLAGHDVLGALVFSTCGISIHVPLAGHDGRIQRSAHTMRNFNPRAPCGARR